MNEEVLALLEDGMAFGFQMPTDALDAARVFLVQLATGFEGAPVRSHSFSARRQRFLRRVGDDPSEDAGRVIGQPIVALCLRASCSRI
jgi:hypothetical protein